jgi:anti-sigma regulatory factor (Ser/Thr protein kinase)
MRFDVTMENVGNARRFVRATVNGAVPEGVADDLVLVTSELVTNAFEHAAASVVVTVRTHTDMASVAVRSAGTLPEHIVDVDGWRTAPPDHVTGRGLGIVQHIADHVAVVRSDGEVEITVRRSW